MQFTEYLYPDEWVKSEVAAKQASVRVNRGPDADLLTVGLVVVANRLKKDPIWYRDYGPYWFALKALLRGVGIDYGSNDDPLMREDYSGKTPVETLVMAERFRDEYLQTFLFYNNKFVLDDAGNWSEIIDGDMEKLGAG
jgi:hypothetical protein